MSKFKEELISAFKKILQQNVVYKTDVMILKGKARKLAKSDESFKPLLSRITTQLNGMKNGVLCDQRRENLQALFHEYLE